MTKSTVKARPWTDLDLGYIASTMDHPRQAVASALGRTEASVSGCRAKIRRGWTPSYSAWLPHEDELIRSSPQSSAESIQLRLPGRTVQAIKKRRQTIGAKAIAGGAKRATSPGLRTLIARTCIGCGLLLPGDWFPVRTGTNVVAYHIGTCRKCRSDKAIARATPEGRRRSNSKGAAAAYKRRAQALTVPLADHNRQEYTESDHKILADPTITTLRKALMLKRTYAATATIIHDMGYKSTAGKLTDPELSQWVIDNPNEVMVDRITESLQKPPTTDPIKTFPAWDWDD